MGTITSIFNLVAMATGGSNASSSTQQTNPAQDSSSAFGEAVNVDLLTETLSNADTGQIVDETIYGASITANSYEATDKGYSDTGFEVFVNLNIPVIVNGVQIDGSGSGNSSGETASNQMNNILNSLEKNIQTAINEQPVWQQREAVDLLMGTVTDFSQAPKS